MHPRVERLPQPDPDYRRLLQVVRRARPDRIPLIELAVDPAVVGVLLDEPAARTADPRADLGEAARCNVRLLHRLGYDVVKISAPIPWNVQRLTANDPSPLSAGAREWTNEHHGPIGSMEDFERFRWPEQRDVDFGPVEAAAEVLPDGMALIGFSGGVLEFSMDLVGMERFMLASHREPELIGAVIERMGQTIYKVFEVYCQMESACAIWLGDDLGHKHGLLVSPKLLKTHVFPWYKRFAELAHRHERPFLLHSCGKTDTIMPTLVEEVGIDAKHSFEDAIQPVEHFIDQWGDKIAVLGGVDVHLLSVGDAPSIRARTLEILAHAAPRGGYACGSGNSIPNYVPPDNYLTMIEALAEFNGRA
ncbi:MAG: uroporphyrinogen decarboxylase family protein [Phycisphaerae bacterium]